jgi:hypothetical protein
MSVSCERMHKGDGSGAASGFSEVVTPLTYMFCFDPEEAVPVMLAAIVPVTVVALDSNDPALRLCEVLIEALDGARCSAFRQIVYAPFLRAVHHTRSHLGVVLVGWRYGRERRR